MLVASSVSKWPTRALEAPDPADLVDLVEPVEPVEPVDLGHLGWKRAPGFDPKRLVRFQAMLFSLSYDEFARALTPSLGSMLVGSGEHLCSLSQAAKPNPPR